MSAQLDFQLVESLKTDGPIEALSNKMREEIGKIDAASSQVSNPFAEAEALYARLRAKYVENRRLTPGPCLGSFHPPLMPQSAFKMGCGPS